MWNVVTFDDAKQNLHQVNLEDIIRHMAPSNYKTKELVTIAS